MCKFCEQYDFGRVGFEMENRFDGKPILFLAGSGPVKQENRFIYCPVCGEKLKDQEDENT